MLALLVTCQNANSEGMAVAERDSAGVRILDNYEPEWSSGSGWQVDPVPLAVLEGALEPIDAIVRSDESAVVLDGALPGLLKYDRNGNLIGRESAEGLGPGEFQRPEAVFLYKGDSIGVFDGGLRRISVFDEDLGFGRMIPVAVGFPRVSFIGSTPAGALLLRGEGFEDGGRRWREPMEVIRIPADGGAIQSIVRVPGWDYYRIRFEGRPTYGVTPFGPRTVIAAQEEWIAIHSQTDCSILLFSGGSKTPGTITRTPCERYKISDEALEDFHRDRIAGMRDPEDKSRAKRFYQSRKLPVPEEAPPFESLLFDGEGFLWAGLYSLDDEADHRWWIFRKDGRWLGEVTVPAPFEIIWIGEGRVIGFVKRETDEITVHVHQLWRDDTGRAGDSAIDRNSTPAQGPRAGVFRDSVPGGDDA